MQSSSSKAAEVNYRRDFFWTASENVDRIRHIMGERRSFLAAASMQNRLQPPVLEIGAEYAVNAMVMENEMAMPVAAVDLSIDALRGSTIVARLMGYQPPRLRVAADAERLPFVNQSFRTVLVWGSLHHFDDPSFMMNEIWRVLTPGGHLVFAEEPIRRRLRYPLFQTTSTDRLPWWQKLLMDLYLLPWVARVGGDEETRSGVTENEFTFAQWRHLFRRYHDQRQFFQPRLTGGALSAGPIARWLWRNLLDAGQVNESLTRWFGGHLSGWACKPRAWQITSPNHYLIRKHPAHNRITLKGFSGAFQCQGETIRAEDEVAQLPKSTIGRASILLNIPRPPWRIDLSSTNGRAGFVTYSFQEPLPPEPASSLACPECVVFTDQCVYGQCQTECVKACPKNALVPTDPVMPVRNSCDGCGLCLHACPYGGLDRPLLDEGRCPECRKVFTYEGDVLELRPQKLKERLGSSHWEKMLRL